MMTNKNNQICAGLDCNRDLTTIKSKSITCDHCENCSAWNAQISQRKYLMVLLHAIKKKRMYPC